MKYRFLIWDAANTRFLGTNSSAAAARWAKHTGCAVVDAQAGTVAGLGESRRHVEAAPDLKTGAPRRFAVGDAVAWTSKAGGYAKDKAGVVVAVVPAGKYPPRDEYASLYRNAGVGMHRDHESYVVHVKGAGVYWPRAKALSLVAESGVRSEDTP